MKYENLNQFFGGYYYQTVWDDYKSDEDIWKQYMQDDNINGIRNLLNEINLILNDNDIVTELKLYTRGGGIRFETKEKATTFLNQLKSFLLENR